MASIAMVSSSDSSATTRADFFYLKPTDAGRAMLRSVELRPPYEGAKDYFYIADVDDRDYVSELVRVTCKHLPLPKRRKPVSPAK